jgi:hypothetical protein
VDFGKLLADYITACNQIFNLRILWFVFVNTEIFFPCNCKGHFIIIILFYYIKLYLHSCDNTVVLIMASIQFGSYENKLVCLKYVFSIQVLHLLCNECMLTLTHTHTLKLVWLSHTHVEDYVYNSEHLRKRSHIHTFTEIKMTILWSITFTFNSISCSQALEQYQLCKHICTYFMSFHISVHAQENSLQIYFTCF